MKKTIVFALFLWGVFSSYAQDCFDKVTKQAIVIDSLQKVIRETNTNNENATAIFQNSLKNQRDTIAALKHDLSILEKFKSQKKAIDAQLKAKSDSIALLETQHLEKDKQLERTKQQGDQKAKQEKERGKAEALASIINSYKNKDFDDLIKSSTKESVPRDMQFVGNNPEIKQVLNDLHSYFKAQELLSKKINSEQITNAQKQLNQIKQKSELLNKLKEVVDKYQTFSDGLKETINKIMTIDLNEKVAGMSDETQKKKSNKIMSEISEYMFNYDFNFTDYPYLSNIVLEIIKLKQPNPDADITELFKEL